MIWLDASLTYGWRNWTREVSRFKCCSFIFTIQKTPVEVKFVLVDPKKVELTLYNKIERHYLAKLPDSERAIITDNKKVINTLNSLCIEMDNRYELLKKCLL